jgi:predicted nucleotidyltransferase
MLDNGFMATTATTVDDIRARRREILRVLAAKGAINPRIFGSIARGTADEASDVDLLVDLPEPRPHGFAYFGLLDDLQQELQHVLGRPVHVTELRDSSPDFAARVSRDAVAL